MRAGGVIHSVGDSQVIRFMGGLSICMPFTSSCLMVSNFTLCGMQFLAVFYSKNFILEMFSPRYVNIYIYFFFVICVRQSVIHTKFREMNVQWRSDVRENY